MLSKEEKLRYGEILRQQMKEKQQRKKMEDMAKRQNLNVPKSQSDRVLHVDPTFIDPKIVLQQKLEIQEYNPFGKSGGGAPNKKQNPRQHNQSAVMLSSPEDQSFPKVLSPQQEYSDYPFAQPTVDPRYNVPQVPQLPQVPQGIRKQPTRQQLLPNPYQPSFETPVNEYPPKQNYPQQYYQKQIFSPPLPQKYVDPRAIPSHQPQQYEIPQTFGGPQRGQIQYNPKQYPEYPSKQYQPTPQQPIYNESYRQEYVPNRQNISNGPIESPRMRAKTIQNEQLQEMYKRGGRNLLRLQNQTTNEHLVKQKQKEQMKNFLKQQMEQAQRKKQQQKQKIKREELQQERRNREYIQMQNQKLRDEERKKNEEKQKIVEDNLKNLAKRKELEQEAKEKLERERLEQERKLFEEQQPKKKERPKEQYIQVRQERPSREDTSSSLTSSNSSESVTKNNFNTGISRQFFRKEKQQQIQRQRNLHDKKLEVFTNQIQKMRDQINNQGEMFKKEMERIKRDAEMAQDQKRKAQLEIQKLRLQLQKKNKESQLRLLEALKRNDPYNQISPPLQNPYQQQAFQQPVYHNPPPKPYQPPQYQKEYDSLNQLKHQVELQDQIPYGIPTKIPSYSAKPMSKNNKIYEQPVYQQKHSDSRQKFKWDQDLKLEQSNIGTLDADSKKIPLNLPQKGTKLTMSNIQNYGKESFMYGKAPPLPPPIQEERLPSHQSRRNERQNRDELDRLVENNHQKWEMSTVKDDITQQIEELLKKKDAPSKLAPSQIQAAGRHALSRGGLPYDGPGLNSLNSNKQSLVSNGTVDVDRIHDRNQARLRELKALGVQTINTTNDEDLNRLNVLLNNYR